MLDYNLKYLFLNALNASMSQEESKDFSDNKKIKKRQKCGEVNKTLKADSGFPC